MLTLEQFHAIRPPLFTGSTNDQQFNAIQEALGAIFSGSAEAIDTLYKSQAKRVYSEIIPGIPSRDVPPPGLLGRLLGKKPPSFQETQSELAQKEKKGIRIFRFDGADGLCCLVVYTLRKDGHVTVMCSEGNDMFVATGGTPNPHSMIYFYDKGPKFSVTPEKGCFSDPIGLPAKDSDQIFTEALESIGTTPKREGLRAGSYGSFLVAGR